MLKNFAEKISCLSRHIGNIATSLILPLIILIVYATCKRYFLDSMPSWGYEVPIFIYGIFFLLGGILCQVNGKHVNVDILPKYVPKRWQKRLNILSNIMIATAVLLWPIMPANGLMNQRSSTSAPYTKQTLTRPFGGSNGLSPFHSF